MPSVEHDLDLSLDVISPRALEVPVGNSEGEGVLSASCIQSDVICREF